MAYQYALITGCSGALVSQIASMVVSGSGISQATLEATGSALVARDLSISGVLQAAINANTTRMPALKVTGNFVASGYGAFYVWSGVATSWTGTLGTPSTLSGAQMVCKNVSTGASLFITGSVDYGINYTIPSRSAVTFISDASTWLVV